MFVLSTPSGVATPKTSSLFLFEPLPCRDVFHKYDTEKSGTISRQELTYILEDCGLLKVHVTFASPHQAFDIATTSIPHPPTLNGTDAH
eukprot:1190657-Prorocentrum_minimum.AAC.2